MNFQNIAIDIARDLGVVLNMEQLEIGLKDLPGMDNPHERVWAAIIAFNEAFEGRVRFEKCAEDYRVYNYSKRDADITYVVNVYARYIEPPICEHEQQFISEGEVLSIAYNDGDTTREIYTWGNFSKCSTCGKPGSYVPVRRYFFTNI